MNILSLFDWISCGRVALERAWIKVDNYFASEIDKYAIKVANKNYPNTIHIGSVVDVMVRNKQLWINPIDCRVVTSYDTYDIDMIIGWSPCQDLSIAKKDWKGLQWEKSWLFFEYVRLWRDHLVIDRPYISNSKSCRELVRDYLLSFLPQKMII